MKVALIATVFNEGEDIFRWAEALRKQTRQPDEFVVVDGGSTDGTPERLKKAFGHGDFPAPKIIVQKCNIAGGRNLAIQNTTAEIVAANDAGSFPDPVWLEQIVAPLMNDAAVDVVGGRSVPLTENEFQRQLLDLDGPEPEPQQSEQVYPSSRNIAFRKKTWADIGGYPEWLTRWAEDALFNFGLHTLGRNFVYARNAVVSWPVRPDAKSYFRMLRNYGYGAAEAQLYWPYFRRRILIACLPPLVLLSPRGTQHAWFRYRKNLASATGWLAGKIYGHRPPAGWRRVKGVLLSPAALKINPQ